MLLFGSSRNLLSSSLLCSADMCGVGGGGEAKKEAPWRFGGVFLRGFCTRVLHTGQVSGRTPAYERRSNETARNGVVVGELKPESVE